MSEPDVFIIESLRFEDEQAERFEGQIISKILRLSGKECIYFYIRTRREFERILRKFTASSYRYLHLSCHGDRTGMATTLDSIPFAELGTLLRPRLRNRRLFVSACSMTNDKLARATMGGSECLSVVGPKHDIRFSDAALLWASFYHIMFTENFTKMERRNLEQKAQEVANMFRVPLNYYGRDATHARGFRSVRLVPQLPHEV